MTSKKVVIVDDEQDLCHLLRQYLLDLHPGYEVHLAYTLSDGLVTIQRVKPDVLFIDNNLPDGLGWEKLDLVHGALPHCKINLISASQYLPNDLSVRSYPVQVIEKPLRLTFLKEYL